MADYDQQGRSPTALAEQTTSPGSVKAQKSTSCRRHLRSMSACVQSLPDATKTAVSWLRPVLLSTCLLVFVPTAFYTGEHATLPYEKKMGVIQEIVIGWESLLHMALWPIVVITAAAAFFLAHKCDRHQGCSYYPSRCNSANSDGSETMCCSAKFQKRCCSKWPLGTVMTYVLCLSLTFSVSATVQSQLQVISPSWVWNPFMWGTYNVYRPNRIVDALDGVCVEYDPNAEKYEDKPPLCLSEWSWRELSTSTLSSRNAEDVEAVLRGIRYAQRDDAGLVINVMSRDTIDAIGPLRQNVEGLVPFFSKVSVVVFENDSKDGTREAFKRWGAEVADTVGYSVDVMGCGDDYPDCVFGVSHRYDSTEAKEYFKSSAIGRMAEFRNGIVDYVINEDTYDDYSHMMVIDLDLEVSISPLGVLHSLGKKPDEAVASAGRQSWPGSFGSLVPPYDFSAFRAVETPRNRRILALHKRFCELSPPGDRWRNQCDALSPMHFMLVLGHDRASGNEPYPVASAFNGATIYPLDLVRDSGAKYDVGDDGQRCEHIGFNLGLNRPMYINPKWNMHVNPALPGGPTGDRAIKNIFRIVFTPRLSFPIFFQTMGCMLVFVYSVLMLVRHLLYPFWVKILTGTRFKELAVPCVDRRANGGASELDFLIPAPLSSLRKRKISDFELADTV